MLKEDSDEEIIDIKKKKEIKLIYDQDNDQPF